MRAICYRLAVGTGFRYDEISSITPESFNWTAPSCTVEACYTKNGNTSTQPLPSDLVGDLRAYVDENARTAYLRSAQGEGRQNAESRSDGSGNPLPG